MLSAVGLTGLSCTSSARQAPPLSSLSSTSLPPSTAARPEPVAAGPGTSQGCLGSAADSGNGTIAWDRLRNPILSYDSTGIRDIGVRLWHGQWHLYFTSVAGNAPDWSIATSTSPDLVTWSAPSPWPAQTGAAGVASPDVTQRPDGTYVVTYQSDPAETDPPGQDKLYYRTSTDLVGWSAPRRLMPAIHATPAERLIDAALAWTDHGLFLGYKLGTTEQHFELAWSASGALDGPWTLLGRPNIYVNGGTIENYQFFQIDGVWHLLATSNNLDQPWLFTLRGDPRVPQGWLSWSAGRHLDLPTALWDQAAGIPSITFEPDNSAYLCDARRLDGHYYLFYVGSNELNTFGGWGHTRVGVARSTNLLTWQLPGA